MAEVQTSKNPHSILHAEINWGTFFALAVLFAALAAALGILLDVGFGNTAPFIAVGLGAAGWVSIRHKNRAEWMVKTKAAADLVWNVWSWLGALVLFFFLAELPLKAATEQVNEALVDDLKGVLGALGPLSLALLFAPVYGAACLRVFLALAELFKKKESPQP